jgi:hypothetical protein
MPPTSGHESTSGTRQTPASRLTGAERAEQDPSIGGGTANKTEIGTNQVCAITPKLQYKPLVEPSLNSLGICNPHYVQSAAAIVRFNNQS